MLLKIWYFSLLPRPVYAQWKIEIIKNKQQKLIQRTAKYNEWKQLVKKKNNFTSEDKLGRLYKIKTAKIVMK